MDEIFYNELRMVCAKINKADIQKPAAYIVIDAYKEIMGIARTVRVKGLLELDEVAFRMKEGTPTRAIIESAADGTDIDILYDYGMSFCATWHFSLCSRLAFLMYLRALCLICEGKQPDDVDMALKAMMPEKILAFLSDWDSEGRKCRYTDDAPWSDWEKWEDKLVNIFMEDCDDGNTTIDENDETITTRTSDLIMGIRTEYLKYILAEMDEYQIAGMLYMLKGNARRKIFDSMSQRFRRRIAEKIAIMEKQRLGYIEDCCAKFLEEYQGEDGLLLTPMYDDDREKRDRAIADYKRKKAIRESSGVKDDYTSGYVGRLFYSNFNGSITQDEINRLLNGED